MELKLRVNRTTQVKKIMCNRLAKTSLFLGIVSFVLPLACLHSKKPEHFKVIMQCINVLLVNIFNIFESLIYSYSAQPRKFEN